MVFRITAGTRQHPRGSGEGDSMTALQKPDGGVHGIVVGDVFRRVVARTFAQQIVRGGDTSFPTRSVRKDWNRVRDTHRPSHDKRRSGSHNSVH